MRDVQVAYLDTSSLAKLVRTEPETAGLKSFLRNCPRVVSSAIAHTELLRVAHRLGAGHVATAEEIFDTLSIVPVSVSILDRAGRLVPGSALHSLDAIHLASALVLPTLDTFVTYDVRQAEVAATLGLPVAAPA